MPMKIVVSVLLLMADITPDILLQRGRDHYRAGEYAEAVMARTARLRGRAGQRRHD